LDERCIKALVSNVFRGARLNFGNVASQQTTRTDRRRLSSKIWAARRVLDSPLICWLQYRTA
jgi:hypothetical protein